MLNRGGFRVAPQTLFIMLLQYKTADHFLLGRMCEYLVLKHPSVAFSWIPLMSCLCIFCPDANVSGCILADVRSRFNVEPINRTVK